MYDVTTCTL